MKRRFLLLLEALLLLIAGCSAPPIDQNLNNPIFASAKPISTSSPTMNSTTPTTTPSFSWSVTGQKLVFLAVFTQSISVSKDNINNPSSIVWAWNTGLGTGREGAVQYSDGVNVVNGVLITGQAPTALISGNSYYWAVWAWDDQGISIQYASKEMYFTVQ